MTKTKKGLISLLMALALVSGLLPALAPAARADGVTTVNVSTFAELSLAMARAYDTDAVINLTADIIKTGGGFIGNNSSNPHNLTLDLCGHTFARQTDVQSDIMLLTFKPDGGNIVVTDSSDGKTGMLYFKNTNSSTNTSMVINVSGRNSPGGTVLLDVPGCYNASTAPTNNHCIEGDQAAVRVQGGCYYARDNAAYLSYGYTTNCFTVDGGSFYSALKAPFYAGNNTKQGNVWVTRGCFCHADNGQTPSDRALFYVGSDDPLKTFFESPKTVTVNGVTRDISSDTRVVYGVKLDGTGEFLVNGATPETLNLPSSMPTVQVQSPVISQQPQSASAAVGGTLTFSVTASNAAAYSWSVCDAEYGQPYGWTTVKAHAAVSGETTAAMTLKPTDTWLNGLAVYCDIKGTDGKWYSSSVADITVTASAVPKPTITTQPVGKTGVKAGTPVTLSAAASGTGTLSYQWYQTTVNDISAIKAVTSALSSAYTVPQTPGTVYYCVGVTNTVGGKTSEMVYSDLVAVTYESAPVITVQPTDQTGEVGGNVTFSVTATGDDLQYEWFVVMDGSPHSYGKDSSSTFTMTKLQSSYSGMQGYVVVSNAYGSVTSDTVTLTVKAAGAYKFPFTDVPEGMWYYGSVKNAHQLGLVNGKTDTTYEPEANMTYAEAVKLAACMYQKYHDGEVTLTNGTEKWYSTYVEYAKAHGIPADFPDYNAQITRREYVKVFYHALPASEYGKLNIRNSIPDVPSTDSAWTEIHTFYEAGILTGIDSAGSFAPDKTIRRNEVAAILSRMMDDGARVSENQ